MLGVLAHPDYARLFAAQVIALLGTGLLTVGLGLTAYQIAGERAGTVLGLALTIKMVAYVGLSPLAHAVVARLDRRRVLIAADLVRAAAALCLPFVTEAWQIYLLIFVLQAASATFTPTFQGVIPDILEDEAEYTRALSLARLAYDLENLLSPVLAGLLLAVVSAPWLFGGTVAGFLASAMLVAATALPAVASGQPQSFADRLTRGVRLYFAAPRLRGLLALSATVSAVGAVVIVQSVVIARGIYGGGEVALAVALGAHGAGSMLAALALPRLLERLADRAVMLAGGTLAAGAMAAAGLGVTLAGWPAWPVFLAIWFVLGLGLSTILTPAGRLLRRSALPRDRPALFAAQFALSHACWLVGYPLAGFLGPALGLGLTMLAMGGAGAVALLVARRVWPAGD
ncbi:MFS transporter [Maritimibacter sp. 55A14]|nr:MFS transporter [Maritimibacter sp. 55A14]PWE32682.1 MFS transporter [Maritimibacter sp. 55A14]